MLCSFHITSSHLSYTAKCCDKVSESAFLAKKCIMQVQVYMGRVRNQNYNHLYKYTPKALYSVSPFAHDSIIYCIIHIDSENEVVIHSLK